jgi:hypothetical protein
MSTMPHSSPEAANTNIPTSVLRLAEHRLDVAVRDFEAVAASFGAPMPASDELLKLTRQVAALTVEIDVDPEIRGDICLLFQVTASGSVEAIAALDQQWHRRVTSIALKWPGLFSLSIDAR